MTESRQDGMGLNTFDGSGPTQYTYYGADLIKQYVHLAPNAIVFLNHLCYSAGNGEPGMAFPTWDLATQRVDNMANGWLAAGAQTVFAYGEQLFVRSLKALFDPTNNYTMEDIFRLPPPTGHLGEYWGWVGADPQKFPSVRTPGATLFMDPDPTGDGWYRAVSGNLSMTASQWALGPDTPTAPNMGNLTASTDGAATMGGQQGVTGNTQVFTPNGDGVTDTVTFNFTDNKETFVDWQVQNSGGTVVRSFSTWAPAGGGSATWDGKTDAGTTAPDGTYTITGTPSSRAGNYGTPLSVTVKLLTAMSFAKASPNLFYASDGDGLSPNTTMTVTMTQPATFSWVMTDSSNNVVRTFANNTSVGTGNQTWVWDGKNGTGSFVPDGTYYSTMTATTSAGTYTQKMPVTVGAFSLTPASSAPFTRGTKVKFTIFNAEPMSTLVPKPKLRVTLPGLAAKVYSTTKLATGGFTVTVNFQTTAQAGTAQLRVTGTDVNNVAQYTDYTFQLK
jgi:flagellar hook assembly protein FlgD